jgi:hypothetical protein
MKNVAFAALVTLALPLAAQNATPAPATPAPAAPAPATPAAAAPQQPSAAAQRAAMQKLAPLAGDYVGSGWMQYGAQSRHTFESHEHLELSVGGTVLEVHGRHKATDRDGGFEALGLVFYDEASKSYRFRSWTSEGRTGEFSWTFLSDDKVVWGNDRMRYTITLGDGTWNEVGEMTRDGRSWMKFFEMNLRKQ